MKFEVIFLSASEKSKLSHVKSKVEFSSKTFKKSALRNETSEDFLVHSQLPSRLGSESSSSSQLLLLQVSVCVEISSRSVVDEIRSLESIGILCVSDHLEKKIG